jgi:hypothetical protein
LEIENAILDGPAADEFVDKDGHGLADAVVAVGGLVFGSGHPPRVVVDDRVWGCEVEARVWLHNYQNTRAPLALRSNPTRVTRQSSRPIVLNAITPDPSENSAS